MYINMASYGSSQYIPSRDSLISCSKNSQHRDEQKGTIIIIRKIFFIFEKDNFFLKNGRSFSNCRICQPFYKTVTEWTLVTTIGVAASSRAIFQIEIKKINQLVDKNFWITLFCMCKNLSAETVPFAKAHKRVKYVHEINSHQMDLKY